MEIPKGYDICAHCNGYGSSLLDPIGVNRCTVCSDSEHLGLVKIEVKDAS
jgi:hypothetical protein